MGGGERPSAGALDAGGVGREGEWRIQGIHSQLTNAPSTLVAVDGALVLALVVVDARNYWLLVVLVVIGG